MNTEGWIGTAGKFLTALLAVGAIVGWGIMSVVGPKLEAERTQRLEADAKIKTQLVLGIRDRIDLIGTIEEMAPKDSPIRSRLDGLREKLQYELQTVEGH